MKILHLLSQTQLTGAEVYASELAKIHQAQGHELFFISDQLHVPPVGEFMSLPISQSHLKARLQVFFKLRSFLHRHQIQVIHCHSRAAVRHASWARRGLAIGLVTTIHGKQHFSWSKRFFDNWGEYKILICENLRQQFEQDFKIPPRSLRSIPNPFDLKKFSSLLRPKEKMRQKRIAFIGRSTGPKGERFKQFFKQGLKSWLQQNPSITLDIIAADPEQFGEDFQASVLTLKDQVRLLGKVANLSQKMYHYDLIIGAGRVAIEGILNHCPVIAFGEALSHGLVEEKNLPEVLASNFGDIAKQDSEPVQTELLLAGLERALLQEGLSPGTLESLYTRLSRHFNGIEVCAQVLETYRAAAFKRARPKWLPILMYHKIPEQELQSQHRIFVTKENFERHLRFFRSQGFTTLNFRDLENFWKKADYSQFPRRPLILTFDDGYRDNLENALPLLEKYNFKAEIFLLADHQILENTWDASPSEKSAALLSLPEKKQLSQNPTFHIGSHGFHHQDLTQIPETDIRQELADSKAQLEKDFKTPVVCFAYPYGRVNDQLPALARSAGYQFAVNTDQGGLHLADAPHSIFRVNIFPEETSFSLWKKTRPWYRKYYWRKRGQ